MMLATNKSDMQRRKASLVPDRKTKQCKYESPRSPCRIGGSCYTASLDDLFYHSPPFQALSPSLPPPSCWKLKQHSPYLLPILNRAIPSQKTQIHPTARAHVDVITIHISLRIRIGPQNPLPNIRAHGITRAGYKCSSRYTRYSPAPAGRCFLSASGKRAARPEQRWRHTCSHRVADCSKIEDSQLNCFRRCAYRHRR